MRLELAERLRCPVAHAPTPLVVVSRRSIDRDLVSGFAGCPVCQLEAEFVDGDLAFTGASAIATSSGEEPELDRVIALLGLAEPGGAVLLTGRYAALADALAAQLEVSVAMLHPIGGPPGPRPGIGAVRGALGRMPFLDATFRGAALDAALDPALAADATRTVVIGGRVLAGAGIALPAGLKQLARDEREWVAERVAVVELRRSRQ